MRLPHRRLLRYRGNMALAAILTRYGLFAIFLGAGIEGEAVVVTGGVLAHRQLVPLWGAIIAATTGSCLVDQLWFLIGRYFRDRRWVRRLTEKPAFARALELLERYPIGFIFAFRFLYGLRTVSPIAIGTSRIPARLFVPLNILAAVIWAPAFTLIGYRFGGAVDPILSALRSIGIGAIALIVAAVLLVALIGLWRRSRQLS